MAEVWKIREDGYLDLDVECNSITYHPNLNTILLLSKSHEALVIDVNSGQLLQRSSVSASQNGRLQATYIPGQDKVLFLNDRGIGVRTDYNGVLLLDTILQTPVSKGEDIVRLELLYSEAVVLQQTLNSMDIPGVEQIADVLQTLTKRITDAQTPPKRGIKAHKWNTVCVELPHCYLKWVCSGLASELKRQSRYIPALPIASAVNERLNSLLPAHTDGQPVDRSLMFSEAMRRNTFSKWPHMNYKWALPDQMAQAGFYHQPNASGDDRAMCFTCTVCLVCWEPADEPWSEHERHSPNCPFVKGEYTQNVPLSVTYATAPATPTDQPMEILGTSSVPELVPTATSHGSVTVWNCSRQLKSEATGCIASKNSYFDLRKKEAWVDQEIVEIPLVDGTLDNLAVWNQEVKLGAVSVVGGPGKKSEEEAPRPVLVAGVAMASKGRHAGMSPLVQAMNDVNQSGSLDIMKVAENGGQDYQLYLVVCDFHYHSHNGGASGGDDGDGGGASKALVSGTGTSASRQDGTSGYPEIFLHKILCSNPQIQIENVLYQTSDGGLIEDPSFPAPSSSTGISCPVPLGVAVPTAGGGTFDTSMAINEGLDMVNFPSTSNSSPPILTKLLDRDSKSDAISELSNGVESGVLSEEPVPIQSVHVETGEQSFSISAIHPTKDGHHILVVLKSCGERRCGMLLLYKLNLTEPVVMLEETPVCVKVLEHEVVSLVLLPLEGERSANPLGVVVVVTHDGLLSLIDIATLETQANTTQDSGHKFVSVTYCNSLERLCAATEKGSLHFFTLQDEDLNRPEETTFEDSAENCFLSLKQSTPKLPLLMVNAEIPDLPTFYQLTRFENMVPCFSATVPSCWSELMQAQKQRRHPQHLQHSDDLHHTRSWRLQKDTMSWDEHIFELTLNNTVCVGHVDLKFSLHAQCQTPPNIQFTLLKQNATGIGKLADNPVDVDSTVDFGVSPEANTKKGTATVNPVLSEEFARAHNTEILCGPISLASCLDLSEQAGTVTFTSPKLMKVRGRTLLVHIKALANPVSTSQDKEKQSKFGAGSTFWDQNGLFMSAPAPVTSAVDRLASNVANKKMEYNGCDWLHEVSITVRKTKQTDVPNERAERLSMLESEWLVELLLSIIIDPMEITVRQSMAFDILLWLAAIRLSRLRPVPPSQQLFVSAVQEHLSQLIHSCFIRGNRTHARKCVRLVILCSENSQDRERENGVTEHFDTLTVKALLESLPQLCQCWSAGALRWYFALLSRLVSLDTVSPVATKALGLLRQVASHLHARQNPFHLLLQTRFGLYGTPFEAEMFDQEAPVLAKFSSLPLGYSKVITSDGMVFSSQSSSTAPTQSSSQPEPIEDLRDLLNMKAKLKAGDIEGRGFQSQLKYLTANHYMKGLLEVQPLHFTCHGTSDGTKLEKIDSGNVTGPVINYFEAPPVSPISPILTNSNGPKKINENFNVDQVPWQQLVVTPPQHVLAVERMHSGARRFVILDLGYPVLLTDLFIPACPDLLSLSIDLWLVSEEHDAQRLVVATDITTKTLIMNDINPSPVVRFIKITTIGRYGMNTTKCKIPIGCFYGHLIILHGEDYAEKRQNFTSYPNPRTQLNVLNTLFEDIQCRYTLACSRLQDLLAPLLTSEIANISHMHHYLHRGSESNKPANSKITTAYQECITYQNQLNSIRSVMRRLRDVPPEGQNSLSSACTDKLRVLGENLLDLLLHLAYNVGFMPRGSPNLLRLDATTCSELFHWLCVAEDTRMQLATSTLLVRMCGLQPWWPDFLTSTLQNLYSSQNTAVFPQDRVFILLVYLGRKSLSGGASRSVVMDSVLKTLLTQLTPLAHANPPPGFLRAHMDLPLVGWLLLFLSQCLDSSGATGAAGEEGGEKKSDKDPLGASSRWDFLQGELSMQRRMYAVNRSGVNKSSYQRKLQRKLMHHKQQLEDLENAKKAFQASTQALSALSSQAAKLSYKLESALKQQEHFLKKSVKQASSSKMSKEPLECKRVLDEVAASSGKPRSGDNNVLCLPRAHCLPVARALIALLLHMDFTCNLDTFLLTCKVLARVALWTRPSLLLGEVMSEEQLVQLVRLAVLKDQRVTTWGSPWACHAITCLLQDMLEGGSRSKRPSPEPVPIEEEQESDITKDEEVVVAQGSSSDSSGNLPVATACQFQVPELPEEIAANPTSSSQGGVPTIKIKINTANFPLPSLLESDDSELEDLLDDILERGRPLTKKPPTPRVPLGISSTISTALDSRLEYGVDGNTEVALCRITAHGAYNLPMSVSAPIAGPPNHGSSSVNHAPPPKWEDTLTAPWQTPLTQDTPASVDMLKKCFDKIFTDLHTSQDSNISLELVLQLWLTLNLDSAYGSSDSRAFEANFVPNVALSPAAISAFIYTLANRGGNSVRCWCLAFQALALMSNLPYTEADSNLDSTLQGMARVIVKDQHFPKLLLSFFSSPLIKGCAGDSTCKALEQLLLRLEVHCDIVTPSSQLGRHYKLLLLQVLDQLVTPGTGIISLLQGPLDAQTEFVERMLKLDFTSTDVTIAFTTLKSVALLVQSHMINSESAKWRCFNDNSFNSALFSSSSTLGCSTSSNGGSSNNNNNVNNNSTKLRLGSKECLMTSILKLCVNLVQIPLQAGESFTTSQTDEHKAATTKLPCVTDMVVQDEQTMHCLLSALGMTNAQLTEAQDPLSTAQAVFLLLSTLARKVTSPKFVLKPVFSYISARDGGLSEPLLSLLLRVVDGAQALQELTSLGALQVICESLVRTNPGLVNCQPSNVSILMQHLSQAPAFMLSTSTKKSTDSGPTLLNFAPLGTITSRNPSAQPADVLIQSTPPHRRARAPAWSYHFYPDETSVELTLTLPCAVLLREVHLQPHLTSLATCPSGVGLEISRDGRSPLVPVNLPLDSSGLTFIRLQLPQPEVVTTVLLRLYKPRDSSNIGLLQIRLLGHTTFTDMTSADDEAQATNSSLMWVRLLYHCMTVAGAAESQAQAAVISAVPGLVQACCGLLLVPTPSTVTPCLQHVLYTLGTHQSELGLQIITTLLDNGSTQFYQGGLSNGVSSVVDLLYLLCSTQDSHTEERMSAVLSWLQTTASHGHVASSTYVQCVAAIIWANPNLQHLLTNQLFSLVYQWTLKLESRSALKRSVDMVLCAMCYVKPVLFPTLLQHMGALVPISATNHAASISDDRKDGENGSLTDDSKKEEQETSEWYNQLVLQDLEHLQLSDSQLMTIAVACQSPPATSQLLDSGLPNLLTSAILEFCTRKHTERRSSKQNNQSRLTDSDKASVRNHVIKEGRRPMVHLEMVSTILQFFAEVCSEGRMRDWLGSPKAGAEFWLPLLTVLCKPTSSRCEMMSESFSTLESATVKFLSRCCWCHPNNQKLLATVLGEVISQQKSQGDLGITGVTRRLILQLLLESEKVPVCVQGSTVRSPAHVPSSPIHPRHGVGHSNHLLYLSVHTTCADIIKLVASTGSGSSESDTTSAKESLRESLWADVSEQMFVAAGITAKDKRIKDAMNFNSFLKEKHSSYSNKANSSTSACADMSSSNEGIVHKDIEGVILPPNLSLSQLLKYLDLQGVSLSTPCIELKICDASAKESWVCKESLLSTPQFPSPLQVFTQQGGLALLAEHLPLIYPETLLYFRSSATPAAQASDQVDADWVKVEATDDIYEDEGESMVYMPGTGGGAGGSAAGKHCDTALPTVPLHSLAAFALFLRLPGYAEVLLKDKRKAQCLLRLVLGVSDDGEGSDILSNPASSSLPTLPFEVLRQLLESTPLSTDDGMLLRKTALDNGVLHLLLACLAVFTHQPHTSETLLPGIASVIKSSSQNHKSDDKSHLYWAKGTGFGTGSTTQSWNVEQALSRQRSEEQHVTVLLQVLSSYINPPNPSGLVRKDSSSSSSPSDSPDTPTKPVPQQLPSMLHDLLLQSCLLPALSSYLRNDSVLDMARHIPLYRSVLQLLRAIAQNSQLVSLLLPKPKQTSLQLSATCLLLKMKNVVDTYASRLKINKPKNQKKVVRVSAKQQEENTESDEGLALLIPDIQETANLVQSATEKLVYDSESESENGTGHDLDLPLKKSLEQRYLEVMKPLQFETYEMITESTEGNGFQFVVSYHFESNVRGGGDRSHPARVKRLAQETVTLSTSLPLSFSSSVFVRCDADRLDIMKVLITGPAETPYANGCFELDVYFPPDYPNSPMMINLETTGHHTIRFNPNLYNDGKVCLSVLNTWHGRPEEKWNAHTSSFLQVLVSIQSLILVPEPYFNEPGYERSRGTQAGNQSSREYNSNICQATVKWAMLEQLRNPSPCFKQVIQTHFWMKRKEIKSQIEGWIKDMESQSADRRTGRTISLNTMALKRHYQQLCEELAKLKPPPGLEDLADAEEPSWQQDMEKLVSQVLE